MLLRRNAGRIVGGEDALIKDHPYQVAWLFNNALHCGASIISAEFLLSAAHCFPLGNATEGSSFRVGSQVAVLGGQHVAPAAFYQHPHWNPRGLDMDVGLIRVETPLQLGDGVQPIRLVDAQYRLQDADQLTITGWGLTKDRAEAHLYGGSFLLQKIAISPVDHQHCVDVYRRVSLPITEHMLCAHTRNKDSCQGDSGGPMVVHSEPEAFAVGSAGPAGPRLLAVVSWGMSCAHDRFPGVYTDLRHPAMRQFIEAVAGLRL